MSGVKFPPYRGEIYYIYKKFGKSAMSLYHQAVGEMVKRNAHPSVIMGSVTEWVHYQLSHKVICLSKSLAAALYETRMDEIQAQHVPFRLFEFCVEAGSGIPNLPEDGALVKLGADTALTSVMMDTLREFHIDLVGGEDMIRNSVRVYCPDPKVPLQLNRVHVDLRMCVGKSLEQVFEELPTWKDVAPLSAEDIASMKTILRLATAALLYMGTQHPEVEAFKDAQRPRLGIKPGITLLGASFHKSPFWHLRRAHFRILRDERFSRDHDGKPRIIWVREAEVGKEEH